MKEPLAETDQGRPDPDHGVTRRHLLDSLLAAGACIWTAGVAVPAALYLWPATSRGPSDEPVAAGSIKDFPIGGARMVQHEGKPLMVLRLSETEFRALSAICTHLACIVRWDETARQIHCPCHAGFFAPDGTVRSGPPPRPLPSYRVVAKGDELWVYA